MPIIRYVCSWPSLKCGGNSRMTAFGAESDIYQRDGHSSLIGKGQIPYQSKFSASFAALGRR
jgi:hypothetical protein